MREPIPIMLHSEVVESLNSISKELNKHNELLELILEELEDN